MMNVSIADIPTKNKWRHSARTYLSCTQKVGSVVESGYGTGSKKRICREHDSQLRYGVAQPGHGYGDPSDYYQDRAKTDCTHLAACVIRHIDYLLTWNCTHLGPMSQKKVQHYNEQHGLWAPTLCTPEALMPNLTKEENLI
jgi:hypothetical protein